MYELKTLTGRRYYHNYENAYKAMLKSYDAEYRQIREWYPDHLEHDHFRDFDNSAITSEHQIYRFRVWKIAKKDGHLFDPRTVLEIHWMQDIKFED